MKRMKTIEEKAKRYDELKVIAQELEEDGCFDKLTLFDLFPELAESEDEKIGKELIEYIKDQQSSFISAPDCRDKYEEEENNKYNSWIAWLEKQAEKKPTLPKWKYKKDHTPLLRDSLILNKYGCVAKSPSGALVSDVWVIDYAELAKLPKEVEKQGEQGANGNEREIPNSTWSEEDEYCIHQLIVFCENCMVQDDGAKRCAQWLKSLRPQSHWKPSKEQMDMLAKVCSTLHLTSGENEIMESIYEQLKKLREE